ncbi:variable large family protein [Borrelia puertoricensis]|uniref:variable large family protein n=1 Tax=Borrelia puertoricensis TaxID=2756107 RepID=UPI003EBEE7DA
MKRITLCALFLTLFLLLGCGSGSTNAEKLAAESKNTFLDSLVKIGHGFYEIFGVFGNAIGDALGLTAVKSGDNKSKVGEHFKTIGDGLATTKDKLDGLAKDIVSTPHADITAVDAVIKGASIVIDKLIASVTKLAGVTKEDTPIGNAGAAGNASAIAANVTDVNTVIEEVRNIIETAEKSEVKIEKGTAGNTISNADGGLKALTNNAQATAGDATKLAAEVAKADPWAMIDKIKNSKNVTASAAPAAGDDAGKLATGNAAAANNGTAASNADLAAAVALKAMLKDGKFTQPAANEDGAVKAAAVSAVNKLLGILDLIIRKSVSNNLDKIREAVKGIQYSETTTETTEASTTTQPVATKKLSN